MNIAIDARWIFREVSGIGQYTLQLIRHLGTLDTRNTYRLLCCDEEMRDRFHCRDQPLPPNFTTTLFPYGVFSPWSQLLLPRRLKQWKTDVYHAPNYMIPFAAFPRNRRGRIGCVTTIHDVIPLLFPAHAPKSKKSRLFPLFVRILREAAVRSDAIITVSRASARDLVRELRIPADAMGRVHPIHNGVSSRFEPAAKPPRRPDEPRTLLYVGRMDPYKNLCTLIRAFARARDRLSFPLRVRMVGAPDPRYPEAPALARDLGIANDVQWTGYLSDDELAEAYRGADLLVHPSRYEGFGLQVLEAMASGLPVLSSRAGALSEVIGDAGITLDPDDVDGYASTIVSLLTDPRRMQTLAARGLARAKSFSWERTALETLAVYREVHAEGGTRRRGRHRPATAAPTAGGMTKRATGK